MTSDRQARPLRDDEIADLERNGCSAGDWDDVRVRDPFDTQRVKRVRLSGCNVLGANGGVVQVGLLQKPAGVYNATLHGCTLGDDARIANVGSHLANYDVGEGACIENVGVMESRPGATFGHGVEVEVLNEGGGREVPLFPELSAQFAHLLCLHRHRPRLIDKLSAIAQRGVDAVRSDRGTIGRSAIIRGAGSIVDVNIGSHARVEGAAALTNGTIVSEASDPALIGAGVHATDFIVAEGAHVTEGALLSKTFVGQGCRIGKQFSAEGCLFFANCEAFHGEACSVFAGPYTVTHHKGTLLIAGQFSFYNAGSSTNQSNHMYKLGPVHEGKVERGGKTGSFSYMMWPCRVGPFSVVLGKHTRHFDTGEFPFSHIEATSDGKCSLIPGFNLSTVGTVRDGAKWPTRDRRKATNKRDRITFDVFSPFTMGRMLRGAATLKRLQETTERSIDSVTVNGAEIKRVLLRSGRKYYRVGLQMHLLEQVVRRLEKAVEDGGTSLSTALAADEGAVFSEDWVDIGGLLLPRCRLETLWEAIESGEVDTLAGLNDELELIHASYRADAWIWCRWAYAACFERDLDELTPADLSRLADDFAEARKKFLGLILLDARKEFDETMQVGFGVDEDEARGSDFEAVRGACEASSFVRGLQEEIDGLEERVARLKTALQRWSATSST